MPLSVEEYQIGQLYSVAEASLEETGGGEGLEVIKNHEFANPSLFDGKYNEGRYTYKIYHIASKVPAFIRMLVPKVKNSAYRKNTLTPNRFRHMIRLRHRKALN